MIFIKFVRHSPVRPRERERQKTLARTHKSAAHTGISNGWWLAYGSQLAFTRAQPISTAVKWWLRPQQPYCLPTKFKRSEKSTRPTKQLIAFHAPTERLIEFNTAHGGSPLLAAVSLCFFPFYFLLLLAMMGFRSMHHY